MRTVLLVIRDRPRRDRVYVRRGIVRLGFAIVAIALIGATSAQAQDWPRLNLFAGGQIADVGTEVKLNATAMVLGSEIDLERDLGFNESTGVVWLAGLLRLSRRNHVQVVWTRVDRDVIRRQLQRDIRFGQETFTASADVDAFLDTWIVGGSYRFAILATPIVELGPLIGLAAINLSTGIDVSGSMAGPGSGDGSRRTNQRDASFTAPAVYPGAFLNLRAHPRLVIRASGGYISADFGDIDGQIAQAQAAAEFMFTRLVGVGGSYSYNRLSVGVEEDNFRGDLRYSFSGPQIYAVFGF